MFIDLDQDEGLFRCSSRVIMKDEVMYCRLALGVGKTILQDRERLDTRFIR